MGRTTDGELRLVGTGRGGADVQDEDGDEDGEDAVGEEAEALGEGSAGRGGYGMEGGGCGNRRIGRGASARTDRVRARAKASRRGGR